MIRTFVYLIVSGTSEKVLTNLFGEQVRMKPTADAYVRSYDTFG
jgi:hypothetical protein